MICQYRDFFVSDTDLRGLLNFRWFRQLCRIDKLLIICGTLSLQFSSSALMQRLSINHILFAFLRAVILFGLHQFTTAFCVIRWSDGDIQILAGLFNDIQTRFAAASLITTYSSIAAWTKRTVPARFSSRSPNLMPFGSLFFLFSVIVPSYMLSFSFRGVFSPAKQIKCPQSLSYRHCGTSSTGNNLKAHSQSIGKDISYRRQKFVSMTSNGGSSR